MRRRAALTAGVAGVAMILAFGSPVRAETPAACLDPYCAVQRVRDAAQSLGAPEALALAKDAAAAWPDDGALQVLLAAAYLRDKNAIWAMRTLVRRLEAAPDDCEARVWLAWTKVDLARYDDLVALLDDPACLGPDARGTRTLLLRALGHHHAHGAAAARADLAQARAQATLYPEDRAALDALTRAIDPSRPAELSWRLDAAVGYSKNPLLGAPSDPNVASVAPSSLLLEASAWARLAPDLGAALRPVLEVEPRVVRWLDPKAAPYSTLTLAGRAGVLWGRDFPRALLTWRPEYLLLSQGDTYAGAPLWYSGAQRGEVEVELSPHLLIFGGAGWRAFRELGRGRAEGDLGVGGSAALGAGASLLWAVTARGQVANDQAYDLLGATGVVSVHAALPGRWWGRANAGLGADLYPRSEAAFGVPAARRDVAVRGGAQLGVALGGGARLALAYDLTWRDSTIPGYGATDHRLTLRVALWGARDLRGPANAEVLALAPLPWGFDADAGAGEERVQDLLRQDEQVRPSCGCGL